LDVLGFIGDKDRYEDLLHLSSEVAMTIGKFRVLDLEELIHLSSEVAMTIGKFRVLDLEELIRQKKATDRPKDRAVIELLEEALRHHNQKD
jgi:hypothetical protein